MNKRPCPICGKSTEFLICGRCRHKLVALRCCSICGMSLLNEDEESVNKVCEFCREDYYNDEDTENAEESSDVYSQLS